MKGLGCDTVVGGFSCLLAYLFIYLILCLAEVTIKSQSPGCNPHQNSSRRHSCNPSPEGGQVKKCLIKRDVINLDM